eukprot:981417-Alexandrium_andersonii.AAC.1
MQVLGLSTTSIVNPLKVFGVPRCRHLLRWLQASSSQRTVFISQHLAGSAVEHSCNACSVAHQRCCPCTWLRATPFMD